MGTAHKRPSEKDKTAVWRNLGAPELGRLAETGERLSGAPSLHPALSDHTEVSEGRVWVAQRLFPQAASSGITGPDVEGFSCPSHQSQQVFLTV